MLRITLDLNENYINVINNFVISAAMIYNPSIETLEDLKISVKETFTLLCSNKIIDQSKSKAYLNCTVGKTDNAELLVTYDINGGSINIKNLKNNIVWDLISVLSTSVNVIQNKISIIRNIEERVYA